ncbi:MAG: sialate O-acetylesterase [Verrucomicrobiaceae bacterium]
MNFKPILALYACLIFSVHARTWTSADGSQDFEADLHSYDPATGLVVVRMANGKLSKFNQSVLSPEDIAYLKKNGARSTSGPAKELPDILPDPDAREADMSKPVQVFILMGQSNMLGFGKVAGDNPGTLQAATKEGKYPYLIDDSGAWTTRKDVRNVRVMQSRDHVNDWMSPANAGKIGPELGIGYALGEAIDAPVLILKSCIGNRSLGWDLLPPGSEQYEIKGITYAGYKDSPDKWPTGTKPKPINWYAGKQYDDDTADAKRVLANLEKYYPGAKDYQIAGFIFWQGDKDRYNPAHASRYEQNLVQLIKSLRKDFDAPDAKFVCATLGQTKKGASGIDGDILKAQLAVDGDSGKYEDFHGNVATVYTHPLSKGGASNGHYNGHAETYQNIGEALGRAMANLLAQ